MTEALPYIAALTANLLFASASILYAEYAHRVSVLWINTFKATIAMTASAVFILIIQGPVFHVSAFAILLLLTSGLIGLNFADLFLLSSFKSIGTARTLMLFGFHPLFVGVAAYFVFGQSLDSHRLIAIVFLLICLFVFSLERYRASGDWEVRGLIGALIGVSLDAAGIILTRLAFQDSTQAHPLEAHLLRCLGACIGFAIISTRIRIGLVSNFVKHTRREKVLLVVGAIAGTFVSIWLGLFALQTGHVATLSALSVTSPMFSAAIECVYRKKAPSKYLLVALLSFIIGFLILVV